MFYRSGNSICSRLTSREPLPRDIPFRPQPELETFAIEMPFSRGRWRPHCHSGFELILPQAGQAYECFLNGIRLTVPPGHLLLIEPGDRHEDILEPGRGFYAFNFRFPPLAQRLIAQPALPVPIRRPEQIRQLTAQLAAIVEQDPPMAEPVLNALFCAIFYLLLSDVPEQLLAPPLRRGCSDERLLRRLHAVFEKHLNQPLDNRQLAAELGISLSQLTHKCTRLLGDAPARAFLRYRIECARRMLANEPELKIKEVADHFGFRNAFHFSRAFKRITGSPPTERPQTPAPASK